jgi:PAS domain S-box-containing protein
VNGGDNSYLIGAIALIGLQAILIAFLVIQNMKHRRVQLALRESDTRFHRMADGAPVMIWTATPEMAVDFLNKTVLEFTGVPMGQLLGRGWRDRVHPDDATRYEQAYTRAFDTQRAFRLEYRLQRGDGSYRWLLDTGAPRFDSGGVLVGYIGSALDITERKELEQTLLENQDELTRAYEQNQDLAGRLIHAQEAERQRIARDLHDDMSQQLAGLAIMLSALKRAIAKPAAQSDSEIMVTTLQDRTAAIADAIRNLSHELHPSVLDHGGLVAALKRHCDEIQRLHRIQVNVIAEDDFESLSPDVALCLFRVAQEALANILRHAFARIIHLQLTRIAIGVELRITDDGVGFVPDEHVHRGLGLRSIDERVRLTRGSIQLESRPGQGTTLMVQIPTPPGPSGPVH